MKAVWFEKTGDPQDVLNFGDREVPQPAEGEVLVRIYASAVNPSDVKKRAGAQPPGFVDGFVIPHSDGAGVIEAVGSGVPAEREGNRVWVYQAQFQRHWGTAAQYVCVPSNTAPDLPDNTGFDVGACIGIPMMTAHRCVFCSGDVAGKNILITGASGRVGYYAAQWAKNAGANVISTAGSEQRCEIVKQISAGTVLNYNSGNLSKQIQDCTDGHGIDHIVDVEFGMNAAISAEVLKNNGSIATYSSSKSAQPEIPFYPFMFKNISINTVLVYNMPDEAKAQATTDIQHALSGNQLSHRIAQTWSLSETAMAHQAIEQGGLDGCVIVKID